MPAYPSQLRSEGRTGAVQVASKVAVASTVELMLETTPCEWLQKERKGEGGEEGLKERGSDGQ